MRPLRVLPAVAALLGALVLMTASPALAAFPGRNGVLVVQPLRGGGLVLVGPRGRGARPICTEAALCGRPGLPRFSPDGSQIVFVDQGSRSPAIVTSAGTCLWCLLGAPLTELHGRAAAFTGDGGAVGLSSSDGLFRFDLAGGSRPVQAGKVSDAVWSTHGAVAFVRDGWVWLVPRRGPARRLAPGGAPAFSPDGRAVAYDRAGWIWLVATRGGAPARLVRGHDPVFSPDGRHLAYIGRSGRVYVGGARGGHARLVPGLRARSFDWQPLPRRAGAVCRVPPGATVLARSPDAVVTENPGSPFRPWYGCLDATGQRHAILAPQTAGSGYNTSLARVELAGRFAAAIVEYSDKYRNCSNTVDRVDLSTGRAEMLYSQDCSSRVRGVDSLGLDSSGFTAWRAYEQVATAHPLISASCPSASLCAAVDANGNAATTTTPTSAGAAWTLSKVAPAFARIVCPTAALCLGLAEGTIATSTDPTGGPGAWSAPVTLDSWQIADVACPSLHLCVAVDGAGNVLTSTNPTGGASAWRATNVDGSHFLTGVACPSTTLCVAVGQAGDVLTSTDPASGVWLRSSADPGAFALGGVSCPSTTLCLSTDNLGNVLTTTTPSAPGPWSAAPVLAPSITPPRPDCPSVRLCLVAQGGQVLASADPTLSSSWATSQLLPSGGTLESLSCAPRTTLCVATDGGGHVLATTNPAGGAGAWADTAVDVPPCGACVAEQLYVRDDRGRQAVDAAQPGAGDVIGKVGLSGDSLSLRWTHAGGPESFGLR